MCHSIDNQYQWFIKGRKRLSPQICSRDISLNPTGCQLAAVKIRYCVGYYRPTMPTLAYMVVMGVIVEALIVPWDLPSVRSAAFKGLLILDMYCVYSHTWYLACRVSISPATLPHFCLFAFMIAGEEASWELLSLLILVFAQFGYSLLFGVLVSTCFLIYGYLILPQIHLLCTSCWGMMNCLPSIELLCSPLMYGWCHFLNIGPPPFCGLWFVDLADVFRIRWRRGGVNIYIGTKQQP